MATYQFNIKKTLSSTAKNTAFVDVKPNTSVRMRFLPATREDGSLWYLTANHFGIIDEEGKVRAPSCARQHGDGDCFYCDLAEFLMTSSDKSEQDMGKNLSANRNWYAQVLVASKDGDGFTYSEPKLVRMSKTTADKVNSIIEMQYESGDDFLFDEENGQDVVLKRTGEKKATRYELMTVGKKNNLEDIHPDWEGKLLDVPNVLKAVPLSTDEAVAGAVRTYGDTLDWDEINTALGG